MVCGYGPDWADYVFDPAAHTTCAQCYPKGPRVIGAESADLSQVRAQTALAV